MSFYEFVVFLHITGVVVAFGVTFAYPLFFTLARRGGEASAPFVHLAMERIGLMLMTPAAVLVLLAGFYLAGNGPYDFGQPWIGAALLILIVILGMEHALMIPRHRALRAMAARDLAGGHLGRDYDSGMAMLARLSLVINVLVIVALFLMVVKPGA
jgi:uncharacterized membrane protein